MIAGTTGHSAERGFSLLEILIAVVVLAFGMLALARGIGRASQTEFEAYQRTQAMAIAQEMTDRINSNRKEAARYVGDYVPGAAAEDCAGGVDQVARDKCEWTNRLLGTDTLDDGKTIGAPLAARGCITQPAPNVYLVAVAWQGILPTAAADSSCGEGQFDREENRRVFSTILQIAQLGA
jgi:type IV pilus assembly protein PilV